MPKGSRAPQRQAVRRLLLGVTGSIGAYKAADLVEACKAAGFQVTVAMTREAQAFITPLTLQVLSEGPVYTDLFRDKTPTGVTPPPAGGLPQGARALKHSPPLAGPSGGGVIHIDLADRADVVLVAPATANILGKLAHGIADDLLTCIVLATRAPVIVAPAMNVNMYKHPAVQANVERLREIGYTVIEPVWGQLACGYEGVGHLADLEMIVTTVRSTLSRAR